MTLSFKDVAEILKIIDASNCEEVVLDLAGVRLEVRKSASGSGAATPASAPARPMATASTTAAASASSHAASTAAPVAAATAGIEVRAPMVGSFYRRPSPKDKPFVEVGQRVKKGDPLCLIEVMKLFNTISSPTDGIIAQIAVEDASLVQFDQLLVVIKDA